MHTKLKDRKQGSNQFIWIRPSTLYSILISLQCSVQEKRLAQGRSFIQRIGNSNQILMMLIAPARSDAGTRLLKQVGVICYMTKRRKKLKRGRRWLDQAKRRAIYKAETRFYDELSPCSLSWDVSTGDSSSSSGRITASTSTISPSHHPFAPGTFKINMINISFWLVLRAVFLISLDSVTNTKPPSQKTPEKRIIITIIKVKEHRQTRPKN